MSDRFQWEKLCAEKLDINGSSKVKINKSNNKNEALYGIRDQQQATMAFKNCYPLRQFNLKYIR